MAAAFKPATSFQQPAKIQYPFDVGTPKRGREPNSARMQQPTHRRQGIEHGSLSLERFLTELPQSGPFVPVAVAKLALDALEANPGARDIVSAPLRSLASEAAYDGNRLKQRWGLAPVSLGNEPQPLQLLSAHELLSTERITDMLLGLALWGGVKRVGGARTQPRKLNIPKQDIVSPETSVLGPGHLNRVHDDTLRTWRSRRDTLQIELNALSLQRDRLSLASEGASYLEISQKIDALTKRLVNLELNINAARNQLRTKNQSKSRR